MKFQFIHLRISPVICDNFWTDYQALSVPTKCRAYIYVQNLVHITIEN